MKTINEIAEKYGIAPIETFKEEYTESEFYETLLNQTDFIPNKILEGVATSAEYADELYYREVARQQISWIVRPKFKEEKPIPKPTGKYSGTVPKGLYKLGSKGEQVRQLQNFLNWYGANCGKWVKVN